jgi:hypothetical protein
MRTPILGAPHLLTSTSWSPLSATIEEGGIELGILADGQRATARLFDERGCTVLVVGRPIAVILALRAAAASAWVQVDVANQAPWQRLIEAEGGPLADRLRLGNDRYADWSGASFLRPILAIRDVSRVDSHHPAKAWTCSLTLTEQISVPMLPAMRSADLVITGRLTEEIALAAYPLLRLPQHVVPTLTSLAATQIVAIAAGTMTVLDVTARSWERAMVGASLAVEE